MSDVNLQLVREYLELNQFTVLTRRKYRLTKREVSGDENIVLMAMNLAPVNTDRPLPITLGPGDITAIRRAAIDVKGWHTDIFSSTIFEIRPNVFGFVSPTAIEYAEEVFGTSDFARILVISELPAVADARAKAESVASERGVDHLLEFPTMLRGILGMIRTNNNYTESDLLQLMRIMKRYRLVKDTQLEFEFD
ncbi:MAG: hypothetical protein J7M12_05715 [Candidatus Hydrogenedentes bacterium]|nr:hypothetical protein [Candidatus Hydrogenedentota bacterium]